MYVLHLRTGRGRSANVIRQAIRAGAPAPILPVLARWLESLTPLIKRAHGIRRQLTMILWRHGHPGGAAGGRRRGTDGPWRRLSRALTPAASAGPWLIADNLRVHVPENAPRLVARSGIISAAEPVMGLIGPLNPRIRSDCDRRVGINHAQPTVVVESAGLTRRCRRRRRFRIAGVHVRVRETTSARSRSVGGRERQAPVVVVGSRIRRAASDGRRRRD